MIEVQSNWDCDVEPQVRKIAKRVFRYRENRAEMVDDAVSLVWEWWIAARKYVEPRLLAMNACRWVFRGKHLQRSERSIDIADCSRGQVKATRQMLRETISGRSGENPALLARVRLDFAAWLLTLTTRQAEILDCFLRGEQNKEIAKKFGITSGRVSQYRRELVARWRGFTG